MELKLFGKMFRGARYVSKSMIRQQGFVKFIKVFGYNSFENIDDFYNEDGLIAQKNLSFFQTDEFKAGYERGIKANKGFDLCIKWRFATALWAAKSALKLKGDFVECGVGKGFMSSGLMESIQWNEHSKNFFLFDTYTGVDQKHLTEQEKGLFGDVEAFNKAASKEGAYCDNFDDVKQNFEQWHNVHLIKGSVPDTLGTVDINHVAYLHIDMNCVIPEIKAMEYFWPKVVPGGFVLLDDYGFIDHKRQYLAMNEWANKNGVSICPIPTGQGLIIKPA